MKVGEAFKKVRVVCYREGSPEVVETVAAEFAGKLPGSQRKVVRELRLGEAGVLTIAVTNRRQLEELGAGLTGAEQDDFVYFEMHDDGAGLVACSCACYLYSFVGYLFDTVAEHEVGEYGRGRHLVPAFRWQRICYDYFLTQEGRIQRNLDRESYVRELARLGFTHIEVNGLAFAKALESGPAWEAYPMFYTYCPALDQFVDSQLNQGLYPADYLAANLDFLKENAALAGKHGLVPGLLCFEPRSVPEEFFRRYPMLRGARVDHPFRSFKPRYNMTVAHPVVREHYAEMLKKLMGEVPELGFISIWSNDSGAGFEHTKSLYVGRNGGAYLIREWKDDEEVARVAGENAVRFLRVLRDSGREVNPGFRVMTRLESFYGEHDTVWGGLGNGMDAETASLLGRGWEMPYTHPKYPDSKAINAGTVYQLEFDDNEKALMEDLARRDGSAHFYVGAGPHAMFEPLLGIPYPRLMYRKLKMMYDHDVRYVAHLGGTCPPELVPYNINHEIVRQFQYNPGLDIDGTIETIARKWAGDGLWSALAKAWELTEEAILGFPNVTPLYSTHGFTWYRLWVRPLVPNIEAIPDEERSYYEDFMCTTPHNPNNVDLSRDVLFQLTTVGKSRLDVVRMDRYVWEPLEAAIGILNDVQEAAVEGLGEGNVIQDQLVRLQALRCWLMTQRNVAAWVAGVYGCLNAEDESQKAQAKALLKDMIQKEIQNTEALLELFDSGVEFMAMTDQGETPLVYGENIKELLSKRIELMQAHGDDEPYIDHDYLFRKSAELT
jgi:hypothetical protein